MEWLKRLDSPFLTAFPSFTLDDVVSGGNSVNNPVVLDRVYIEHEALLGKRRLFGTLENVRVYINCEVFASDRRTDRPNAKSLVETSEYNR